MSEYNNAGAAFKTNNSAHADAEGTFRLEKRLDNLRVQLEEERQVKINEVKINAEKQKVIEALEMQINTLGEINDRYALKIVELNFIIKKFMKLENIPFKYSDEDKKE